MKYYLAYGSNLNKEQMAYRCPGAIPVGTMMLEGYELLFRAPGVLTIEEKAEGKVPIGIWKVNERHEKALDRYEGYPRVYHKKEVEISNERKAFVYIMNEGRQLCGTSLNYYDICRRGYKDFGLDEKYLKEALKRSTEGMTE